MIDLILILSVLTVPAGAAPRDMMKIKLLADVDTAQKRWREAYESRKTPEQIAAYQKAHKRFFLDAIGGLPDRTPLNARVTGKIVRKGFAVEKVIFESRPKHFVTAALFMPDPKKHKPPYPGVLIPCGHSRTGKGSELYQKAAALLALNGMAALVFDPIEQGERSQFLNEKGRAPIWGTKAHTMVGVGSILLGRNTARFEVWDGMRGIDYLQSRPEVDGERIGCMGNSGGGTQTCYLMCLDERIDCASPSCYVCALYGRLIRTYGPQDAEQNIHGQLAFGMDHADYVMMRAPRPTLLCTATRDFFDINDAWDSFRRAKRLYGRMGFSERVDLAETDNKHGYHQPLREAAARWMSRWLREIDDPITEPADLKVLSDKEILCTPKGQVMLLEGARSAYDLNIDYEKQLAAKREKTWSGDKAAALAAVRKLAGIRPLEELPEPGVEEKDKDGKLIFRPEKGVYLPASLYPGTKDKTPVLYVHEKGRSVVVPAKSGSTLLAVDLRGTGETQQGPQRYFSPQFGPDGQDVYVAYLLGRSFVGMRAEDIICCARWLAKKTGAKAVRLVAVGHVGVPALHAAALEPAMFESVRVSRTLKSWSNVIHSRFSYNQLINTVHGALTRYDLPDLVKVLGDKVEVVEPLDAMERPLGQK
jgi:dienelactone hydrolase